MTKLTRASTFHESTQRKSGRAVTSTAAKWLELDNSGTGYYPHWDLSGSALRVQTGKLHSNEEHPNTDRTFLSDTSPFFTTSDQAETTRTCPVPESVLGSVIVSIRGCVAPDGVPQKARFLCHDAQEIRWQDATEYDRLREIMDFFVQRQQPIRKREYLTTSRVRLLEQTQCGFKEVDSCTVETKMQWDRFLPRMIARFCGSEKLTPFFLELNAEYEWFTFVGDPDYENGKLYVQAVQNTLTSTVLKNFENEEYWSKKLLKRLFDHDTIRKLVIEYVEKKRRPTDSVQEPVHISDTDRDAFAKWLSKDRIRLLAAVIRINADLDCLYKRMEQCKTGLAADIKDSQIPLRCETYASLLDSFHHPSFRHNQAGFGPVDFPEPMKAMEVRENDLVPILFNKQQPLGSGGTSDVFRATIHPDYHAFSSNKHEVFALKIPKRFAVDDAEKEVKNWQRFARIPHPHINTFHTCWIQREKFYMLSPLAELTLEDFLNTRENPELLYDAEWILEQLEGIAWAIQHIHHVGRAGWDNSRTISDKIDNGYHHDLKPANILIFGLRHWKITDFGTARVRQVRSSSPQTSNFYTLNLPRGDEQYGGPDRYTVECGPRRVGGAYDIWSFGCIILEVLLWSFGKKGKDLADFRQHRADDRLDACKCQSGEQLKQRIEKECGSDSDSDDEPIIRIPTFWYQCEKDKNKFHLKPSVQKNLGWIKEQTRQPYPILVPLHNLVKNMLNVHAKNRPAASVILSQLGILRIQASAYFANKRKKDGIDEVCADENPDFDMQTNYDSYARSSRMGSMPPTDAGTIEPLTSGQPSQQSTHKRRRASSAHSLGDLGPMPPEVDVLSHAGDNLSSQAPLPGGPSNIDLPDESRRPVKKQRSDSQLNVKIEINDTEASSDMQISSSAPGPSNNKRQNATDYLSADWKKATRPARTNPDSLTWIEKQISSSSRSS